MATPLVIAHRGASGYLPEHTLEAKVLAHAQGADYLEQDVVATADGELIVLHDIYLELVTDVERVFPDRQRDDGHYYAIDFTLADIRQLKVGERRWPGRPGPAFQDRFPADARPFRVSTLAEELQLVRGLNRSTGRPVGIYPEIKHPGWHMQHGVDLPRLLLSALEAFGYRAPEDPVFVQCFDAAALRRTREELGTALKLVQLIDQSQASRDLVSPEGLDRIAEYAQGIGPAYPQLLTATPEVVVTPLMAEARRRGLTVHPYTFRRERLPDYASSLEALLELFYRDVGVDGVFCDYPDVAVRVRDALA